MAKILVTGSRNGLGALIVSALLDSDIHEVVHYDIEDGKDVLKPDLTDISELDILINCAGINRINWLENVSEDEWDDVMGVNAKGIFTMTKACLSMLISSRGTILNIVSNAARNPMTCSLAYNASKGAADIMTKQLARELTKKYGVTVFGISPNKLAGTKMSDSIDEQVVATRGWTEQYAKQYQLNGLLTGEETDTKELADFIAYLLSTKNRHKHLSGCVMPYGN